MFVILSVGLSDHSPKSPGGCLAPGPQTQLLICWTNPAIPTSQDGGSFASEDGVSSKHGSCRVNTQ